MDTGDPTNLFSNLLVLYAMYMISYTDQANKYKSWFIKSIRTIVFIMGLICFAGWLDILTVKEFNEQYYIVFSENMRLGDFHLLNIHAFMIIIGLKMANFLFIILMGSLIGLQLGIVFLIHNKGIPLLRSIVYSFSLYTLPFLMLMAHIDFYKTRHKIFREYKGKNKNIDYENIKEVLDSKKFLFVFMVSMLRDFITPKDNLIILLKLTEIYEEKYYKKKHHKLMRKEGLVGVLRKALRHLKYNLMDHAAQMFSSGYKARHP